VDKLDELECRREFWALLKNYRDDEITSLEELLEKIMAVLFPEEQGKKIDNKQKKLF